jgi:hypothetical protein
MREQSADNLAAAHLKGEKKQQPEEEHKKK